MSEDFLLLFENWGISQNLQQWIYGIVFFACILVLAFVAGFYAKKIILSVLRTLVKKTKSDWDDALLSHHVFDKLSHIAPVLVFYLAIPFAFSDQPKLTSFLQRICYVAFIFVGLRTIDAFLTATVDVYQKFEISRTKPIKSYFQVLKIFIYLICTVLGVAALINQSPWGIISGLGAMTAILLLVFKDAILGFVASIQLSTNDMIRQGDWIEIQKIGADGEVIDMSLTTIKIQNWDKTITTVPTYTLISDSFKNWRGMSESGGRRIKRSVLIDVNTIRFCDSETLKRFEKVQVLKPYLLEKTKEIEKYNQAHQIDTSEEINGRRLTNIGCFRAYLEAYLRNNPKIYQEEMTFLVRQLAPREEGLPIEIYVFSKDQNWIRYEAIQSDIFDHLFAVLDFFGLRAFQSPSGGDFKNLIEGVKNE